MTNDEILKELEPVITNILNKLSHRGTLCAVGVLSMVVQNIAIEWGKKRQTESEVTG